MLTTTTIAILLIGGIALSALLTACIIFIKREDAARSVYFAEQQEVIDAQVAFRKAFPSVASDSTRPEGFGSFVKDDGSTGRIRYYDWEVKPKSIGFSN